MTSGETLTATLFARVEDWAQPMLTFYDDATGERTELSAATLGNWAAKTANYLVSEAGIAPGDTVGVDLPEHWQTAAILLGSWWSGAQVLLPDGDGDLEQATVVFTTIERVDAYDNDEVIVASLDPFGMPRGELPVGVGDFGSTVRVHGDQYRPEADAGAALDGEPAAAILTAAMDAATAAGISAGSRVLSTGEWHTHDGIVGTLLAPLLAGASLVAVVNSTASADSLAARAETERARILSGGALGHSKLGEV